MDTIKSSLDFHPNNEGIIHINNNKNH